MFRNYLLTAYRNIKRQKLYSFINITGLAIGMACCIVILLFVQDELSYDRYHKNARQIYRITSKHSRGHTIISPYEMAPNMVNDFPEVVDAVRIIKQSEFVLSYGEKRFVINPVYADPSILDVFTFPLIRGDKKAVLKDPNSVVISEELAEKFFGDDDPIGKILTIYDLDNKYNLKVTGILRNVPYNSHFMFHFLAPIEQLQNRYADKPYSLSFCSTYLLLNKNASPEGLEKKFPNFTVKYFGERYASIYTYFLQPLTSIHLNSNLGLELGENSNITYSYAFSAVAIIILIIACINFINLSTARASRRFKEVGLRKVVGANRFQLLRQFLGESVFLSFIALLLAVILTELFLPFFNNMMSRHLTVGLRENHFLYVGLFLLTLFVGFLSGSYPSIFLSSLRPVEVFKGDVRKDSLVGIFMRKGLVVFQFAISVVFIIGTIVALQQLNFVNNKNLGFDKENIINIPIFKDHNFAKRHEMIKSEISRHPNIIKAVVTYGVPGMHGSNPIQCIPEGLPDDEPVELNTILIGEDYFDFFGIDIVKGRDFSKEISSDKGSAIILNETAVKKLGWESPIGKRIKVNYWDIKTGTVIGVVKDHHNGSLHEEIKPSVYLLRPDRHSYIFLKIYPDDIKGTISFLEKKWQEFPTHLPLNYLFYDESLENNLYREDRKVSSVLIFSSALAIILACLGLFGLASFAAERRTKEIGIRKVLGSSVSGIVALLSKEFLKWVLIANIIAWPVAYYAMNKWLQNFAYRINIGWWVFVLAGLLALVIALVTVSYQAIKAARANPVDALRYE